MTRRSFWAQKMPKKFILGQSCVWKKVVAKLGSKWGVPSLNGHHRPNFWLNPKMSGDYFGLWIFLKRSFLAWVTDDQSLVPNCGTFCPVFTPIRHFFWLSLFSLPLCTFFGHFLSKPPLRKSKTPACGRVRLGLFSFLTPTDLLRLGFSRGGYNIPILS